MSVLPFILAFDSKSLRSDTVFISLGFTKASTFIAFPLSFQGALIHLGSEFPRRRSLGPNIMLHRILFSIQAPIRRIKFVDDDGWWRCLWLDDNADAGTNLRLVGESSAQSAANDPNEKGQQKIDGSNKKVERVMP
jgi:hypothetical protein